MSYKVRINNQADSGDGISVEAEVNEEPVAHTFPKGLGFFEEPEEGSPPFVEKLIEKYEEKMKREGKMAQSALSDEEQKVHSNKFLNNTYRKGESFKDEKNQNRSMEELESFEPEEIRKYLKDNMAEGYLSKSEEENIDAFVDRYKEMMENDSNSQKYQEVIRKVYEGQVQ